jgi:hypothetical protein
VQVGSVDHLQRHRHAQVGVEGLVSHTHRPRPSS